MHDVMNESVYTNQNGSYFETDFYLIILPTYNVEAQTAEKTLLLIVASFSQR
jgi:hypothetical protein